MPSPLVSVVMPFRNAQRFLNRAIRSVLDQTFSGFELLLIDDFSEDESGAIAEGWGHRDPRVILMRNRNQGLINALNQGIAAARGPLIARMDADDACAPQRFERQVDALQRNSRIAVLGSAARMIDEHGRALGVIRQPTQPAEIHLTLLERCCVSHPTTMMRADVVRALGGYRSAFVRSEDYDLWLRVSEQADIANLDECLLDYRLHEGQVTWSGFEQRILSELAAVAAAKRRRAGQTDIAADAAAIDRAAVLALGVPSEDINRQMLLRTYGAALDAYQRGQNLGASAALDIAYRQPSVPLLLRLRFILLLARLALRRLA